MSLLLLLINLTVHAHAKSPEMSKEVIVFQTNFGDIAFRLYPKDAPKTSAQILALVNDGKYEGVELSRVVPNFIIQTDRVKSNIKNIPFEKNDLIHLPRRLSLARNEADLDSGHSSFSFMLGRAPHLDHQYTVFGEVIGGWDTLMSLSTLPRFRDGEVPIYRIVIERTATMLATDFKRYKQRMAPELTDAFIAKYSKPEPDSLKPRIPGQNVLYAFVTALLFLISSVFMHIQKKTKMVMSLVLLSILVLVYGLVEFTMSMPVFPVSWASIGLFFLVVLTIRLMSRFENL